MDLHTFLEGKAVKIYSEKKTLLQLPLLKNLLSLFDAISTPDRKPQHDNIPRIKFLEKMRK